MIRAMKKNPRKDFTQTAFNVVQQATEAPSPKKTPKQEASKASGTASTHASLQEGYCQEGGKSALARLKPLPIVISNRVCLVVFRVNPFQFSVEVGVVIAKFHDRQHGSHMLPELRMTKIRRQTLK